MNVRKFSAPTAREALRQVRDALGPDAVILSNRGVDGGVEIIALPGNEISTLVAGGSRDNAPRREAAAPARPVRPTESTPVRTKVPGFDELTRARSLRIPEQTAAAPPAPAPVAAPQALAPQVTRARDRGQRASIQASAAAAEPPRVAPAAAPFATPADPFGVGDPLPDLTVDPIPPRALAEPSTSSAPKRCAR